MSRTANVKNNSVQRKDSMSGPMERNRKKKKLDILLM